MLKTYSYVSESLKMQINQTARTQKNSKAEIMRKALEKGLISIKYQDNISAQALLKVRDIGRKHMLNSPKDGSEKMDDYLWGKND